MLLRNVLNRVSAISVEWDIFMGQILVWAWELTLSYGWKGGERNYKPK